MVMVMGRPLSVTMLRPQAAPYPTGFEVTSLSSRRVPLRQGRTLGKCSETLASKATRALLFLIHFFVPVHFLPTAV